MEIDLQRDGQVEEQGAWPGLVGGLDPQLVLALGGGVRLGGQQLDVQVGGFAAATGGLASGVPSGALHSPNSRS